MRNDSETADDEPASEDHESAQAVTQVLDRVRLVDASAENTLLIPVEVAEAPPSASPAAPRRRWSRVDLAVHAAFLLFAFWITHQYWMSGHVSAADVSDQAFFEYMLAHGAQSVIHLSNPLFAAQLNVPVGVNLMVNTSVLALAIPLTPVTLLFGPAVSFALLMTLGLAATAAAWYHVLSRHLVASRSAAVIGGLIAGFGPGMVSHAAGHPNIIGQFLVPFIAWRVIRLGEQRRSIRNGIVLGLLVTVQAFINEEILLIVALGIAVFVGTYALSRPREIAAQLRPFAVGLGIAVACAGALLAYPLWWQFFGPNTYHGLSPGVKAFSTDLAAFPAFATQTVFGGFTDNAKLSQSVAEQNTFLGWPLVIASGVAIYWLRRHLVARAAAVAALALGALSLGSTIKVDGHNTGIIGPWRLVNDLPLFDSAVPTRFSLLVLPLVAVLIALAHDRAIALRGERDRPRAGQAHLAWCLLLAVALVAVIPTPVPTQTLAPTPAFFSTGQWRTYVPAGETVLPVPLPGPGVVDAMFWSAQDELSLSMSRGYFLGPDPVHHDVAFFGAPARPTATLLAKVLSDDEPAVVRRSDRTAALADLRYWRVAVIVQVPGGTDDKAVRATINDLVGSKPKFRGGVWVWDVRALVAGVSDADLE